MRKHILVALMVAIGSNLLAQVRLNKDSLLGVLAVAKNDTNKALLFISIGQQYEGSEPEVAKQYYRNANALSSALGYVNGNIKFVSNYSYVLNMQGQYDSGLLLNLHGVALARVLGDSFTVGKMLFNVGTSYRAKGDYIQAVKYYESGKSIFQQYDNEEIEGQADDILQLLYHDLHQYERAIQYGNEAVRLNRKLKDSIWMDISLNNLGMNYVSVQQYDRALACFNEALAISKKIDDKNMEASQYLNIGDVFFQKGDYEKTKPYFDKALVIAEALELNEATIIAKKGLSLYYLSKRDYTLAYRYANEALAMTYQYKQRTLREKIFSLLSNIAFGAQNMRDGEAYSLASVLLYDSLLNEKSHETILELEKKYETSRKDGELKLQQAVIQKQGLYNYILLGGAVALVLILLLLFLNYKQKQNLQQQRINELESEKKLTATEAVLKGEEKERTRLAKDLHDGLGGMLSGIKYSLTKMKGNLIMTPDNALAFERSIDMLDSSIKEMRRVAHNMMPETLVKFGLDTALKDFCNDINQWGVLKVNYQSVELNESLIDQTTGIAIYRIAQELLNNVMKHAAATTVVVQVAMAGNEISITVEDDGKGFDVDMLKEKSGMGWSNIESRVAYLKGKIDIRSEPGKGTSVLVEFKSH